jgi:hypothetical protein
LLIIFEILKIDFLIGFNIIFNWGLLNLYFFSFLILEISFFPFFYDFDSLLIFKNVFYEYVNLLIIKFYLVKLYNYKF